jgi:predicted transcriptional regulator
MKENGRNNNELLALTVDIVSSHVANNTVPVAEIAPLIEQVYQALVRVGSGEPVVEKPKPAVTVRRSVTPNYIVCLEDGKRLKMLKRHLKTRYDLTPDEYREKWGLPSDYPMVAPNYAAQRRELAKQIGLGTLPRAGRRKRGK